MRLNNVKYAQKRGQSSYQRQLHDLFIEPSHHQKCFLRLTSFIDKIKLDETLANIKVLNSFLDKEAILRSKKYTVIGCNSFLYKNSSFPLLEIKKLKMLKKFYHNVECYKKLFYRGKYRYYSYVYKDLLNEI